MKFKKSLLFPILTLSLCFASLTACSTPNDNEITSISGSQVTSIALPGDINEDSQMDTVYRGVITDIADENITVEQVDGYDYGQPSILFFITEETVLDTGGLDLEKDMLVEIDYDGLLSRSLPPQGSADTLKIITPVGQDAIVNGTIADVEKDSDVWRITLLPLDTDVEEPSNHESSESGVVPLSNTIAAKGFIVLNVPFDALENLAEDDLAAGTMVSAITTGVATMSIPPQMPVYKLLPFIQNDQAD